MATFLQSKSSCAVRRLIEITLGLVAATTAPIAVAADTIVTCKNPSGYAYYHHTVLVSKKSSGFSEDKISDGIFTLVRVGQKEYDLLFVDTRKTIISAKQDGGYVRLLRKGTSDATFLIFYPGMSIEIYTIYKDAGGSERFDLLQSKGGDAMPVHKSAVLTGSCSGLKLNILD